MKKRVMVVDDTRIMELQIEEALKDSEYEVVAYCRNGPEAIARYGDVLPDVITMDILMPGMDGLETARTIIEKYPEARVVMVSSLAFDDTIDEAVRIGARTFVYKPFTRKELLCALDIALK